MSITKRVKVSFEITVKVPSCAVESAGEEFLEAAREVAGGSLEREVSDLKQKLSKKQQGSIGYEELREDLFEAIKQQALINLAVKAGIEGGPDALIGLAIQKTLQEEISESLEDLGDSTVFGIKKSPIRVQIIK